jgi:hypothetical protein
MSIGVGTVIYHILWFNEQWGRVPDSNEYHTLLKTLTQKEASDENH